MSQTNAGTLIECRGGPLDGQRHQLPVFSPNQKRSMAVVLDDLRSLAPESDRPIRVGEYDLYEPEDGAPFFQWMGE